MQEIKSFFLLNRKSIKIKKINLNIITCGLGLLMSHNLYANDIGDTVSQSMSLIIDRASSLHAGDWVIVSVLLILVALSLITWWIALIKFLSLRRVSKLNEDFLSHVRTVDNWPLYVQRAQMNTSCMAYIARSGIAAVSECQSIEGLNRASLSESREYVGSSMRYAIQQVLQQQEKGASWLASIGSISPFVGLFGTVWGIMEALKTIGVTGQASIDVVAGPVGEALIATAIGIATAIPAVVFYNTFIRRQRLLNTQYEGYLQAFFRVVIRFNVINKGE